MAVHKQSQSVISKLVCSSPVHTSCWRAYLFVESWYMFVTAILDGMMVKYVIFKLFNHTNVQSVNVVLAIGALYVNILAASGGVDRKSVV